MLTNPIVYGSIVSPYVRKVVIALNIKNVNHEIRPLNPFLKSDKDVLYTMNPMGKIPIYQDGNFIISDSSVICAYLEKKFPEISIFPNDPEEYARSLWFEEYADTQLIPSIITVFFNTVLAPRFNLKTDRDLVNITLDSTLPNIFDYLDKEIGSSNFIVGDQLTIADISIGQLAFIHYDFLDFKIDLSKWKNLSTYIYNISNNKLFKDTFLYAVTRMSKKTESGTTS